MDIKIIDKDICKDAYMDINRCANRLYNEYKEYGNLIIAYDFDDTVYSEFGNTEHDQMIELLQICNKLGFELIVYTCRPEEEWEFVREYLSKNNIPFSKINDESNSTTFPKSRQKIFYNIFFDDRAGLKSAYESLVGCISLILEERGDL